MFAGGKGAVHGRTLRPVQLPFQGAFRHTGKKYADMVEMLDDSDKLRNFLRMEKGSCDSPDRAAGASAR